jgi:hypothetical protein
MHHPVVFGICLFIRTNKVGALQVRAVFEFDKDPFSSRLEPGEPE